MTPSPKARTLAKNFKQMSAAELKALEALLADSIAARETPAASDARGTDGKRKSHKREHGAWDEVKLINGHLYRYHRFWQGGKLRSKYLGRA